MRQTRRSRSAATPQKDESANQDNGKVTDNSAKANLETVLEKDCEVKDEVGASAELVDSEPTQIEDSATTPDTNNAAPESTENVTFDETTSQEKLLESSLDPLSPKKGDTGAIELNCQVCNCSFTNYHEHMNSEAHKSKITPITNSKGDGQVSGKTVVGQAQKRAGDQDGGPAAKRLRNHNTSQQNASPEKFHCDVCNLTLLKQQDFEFHMNGKRHLMNVNKAQGKSYCEICKLFFNTVTDLNDHTESQLHKKNVAERKQDRQMIECTVCNVTSCGQRQHEQHLTSKRHKKSLERPSGPVKGGENAVPSTAPSATSTAVNGKVEPSPNQVPKKWIFFCNACNFGFNQDQQLSSHMNLAEHKAAVTDMRKKGLVIDRDFAKPAGNKPGAAKPSPAKPSPAKPAISKPPAAKLGAQKLTVANNVTQSGRKFTPNNSTPAARNNFNPQSAAGKPSLFRNVAAPGPVTKVTYNIVPGPNLNTNASIGGKPNPMKKGPQGSQSGSIGSKKNLPLGNAKHTAANAVGGRPNPRFGVQQIENQGNKFMSNAPMKMGGNFSPAFAAPSEVGSSVANFGNYGGRLVGNYGTALRNSAGPDGRNDFRGSVRDEYPVRDIRDIRDIRNVDIVMDNRSDGNFRSGFYRDIPGEGGRDARADYGGNFRGGDTSMDSRSDTRSGVGPDVRGMVRSDIGRELGSDIRSYGGSNNLRDLQNAVRIDYMRERSSMVGYGGSAGFGQQNYRGNDDFGSESYGRGVQSSVQGTSTGSYSGGMMASGRFDNFIDRNTNNFIDRNTAGYGNQYGGSSRGMGYIGDMALNGR